MNNRGNTLCYKILIFICVFVGSGFVNSCEKHDTIADKLKTGSDVAQYADNDSITIGNIWIYFIEEPGYHLAKARYSVIKNDIETAVYEIRRASAFILLEAIQSTSVSKEHLMKACKQLETLAMNMQSSGKASMRDIDKTFTKDLFILARHFQLKAVQHWQLHQTIQTGFALKAAVLDLEKADVWTESKMKVKDLETVQITGELAEKMIKNETLSVGDVQTRVEILGDEIREFGKNNG